LALRSPINISSSCHRRSGTPVLGNIGTIISFRVGAEDGPYLAKEFQEEFDVMDLIRLANYRAYIKLMIDGTPSKPFSAATDVPGRRSD